ncbi:MAG TPA: ABC transporter substrate-binding protein, partial [Candidatus Limnocylindrales bacterium]|nr:ABC transporter substrate-binding protein [Candidatus Limnocylindrales bacterium]
GVSKGGKHPLWSRVGFKPRSRIQLIVLLLFAGSIWARPAAAQERVRMALSVRNVVFLPFYYAKDTRIFDKHGMNVELIQMRSDLQLAGLVSGEIDYTPSVGPAGAAIANSLPVKALAILYRAPLFSLVSPPSTANVKELEGKKVAVSRIGSESHRYGSLMLESGGADPKKVTFIQTGSTTISLAAIQQGTVNAAVLSPPFTGIMAEKGYKILARSRSLAEAPWLGLVANRQKIEKQADQVRNMLRSMRQVTATIRREKAAVISYIEKNFKVSSANASESYDDISGVMVDGLMLSDDQIQKYLDTSVARGEISKRLTVSELFDFSLLRSLK